MSYPYYSSHIGSKVNKFDGLIYYLKEFKAMIDKQKEIQNKRVERIDEQKKLLEKELNKEHKNIEEITFLNNCISENIKTSIAYKNFSDNNMTILLLDLCEILL
jgi:hypothetical protein